MLMHTLTYGRHRASSGRKSATSSERVAVPGCPCLCFSLSLTLPLSSGVHRSKCEKKCGRTFFTWPPLPHMVR
jgi:hypothetical protein